MSKRKPGDKSRAICAACSCAVDATYSVRDIPFSDGLGLARGILALSCDRCGTVVAIPAESAGRIRAERARAIHSASPD